MALFRYHFLCAFALSTSGSLVAQQAQPTAAEVMARVAQHQDESEAERAHYLYVQHTKTSSRNGKTVMCEETTDYRITPSPDGSHGELLKVEGRVLIDRQVVQYAALLPSDEDRRKEDEQARSDDNVEKDPKKAPPIQGGDGIDRNIVEHLRQNLLNDDSKDGISAHLFPLTSKAQTKYAFTLAGREHLNGRDVFDIKFRPKDKKDFGRETPTSTWMPINQFLSPRTWRAKSPLLCALCSEPIFLAWVLTSATRRSPTVCGSRSPSRPNLRSMCSSSFAARSSWTLRTATSRRHIAKPASSMTQFR